MDDGALIHEKGLEMVRNIYNDLLKTADYRDRMEIEKYAMLSESIKAFVKRAHISLRKSLDLFYKSELYTEISEGISDMHCRSGEYLAEELSREVEGNRDRRFPLKQGGPKAAPFPVSLVIRLSVVHQACRQGRRYRR
jgi:hypothetical protein